MRALLTLEMVVDGKSIAIDYHSVEAVLEDDGLQALFDDGLVAKCEVHSGGKRIAGLPLMEWKRLQDAIISNSTTLLRRAQC